MDKVAGLFILWILVIISGPHFITPTFSKTFRHGAIDAVAIAPNQTYYVTGATDGTVIIWSYFNNKELVTIHDPSSVEAVAISPDSQILVTGTSMGGVYVWSRDGQLLKAWPRTQIGSTSTAVAPSAVEFLKFAPDGRYFVSGDTSGTAQVWSPTGDRLQVLQAPMLDKAGEPLTGQEAVHSHGVQGISISGDSQKILITNHYEGLSTLLWNRNGQLLGRYPSDGFVGSLIVPHTDHLATVDVGRIQIWKMGNASPMAQWMIHDPNTDVYAMSVSPDGSRLVAALWGSGINIINASTGQIVTSHNLKNKAWFNRDIPTSKNGKCFVTISSDHTTRVWNWQGQIIVTLDGIPNGAFPLDGAFSADGSTLILGDNTSVKSDGGAIRRWSVNCH